MATTPITTSGVASLGKLSSYSWDSLQRMFECVEAPVQSNIVMLDMASGAVDGAYDDVLSAPGSGKAIFLWSADAAPTVGSASLSGRIALANGGTSFATSSDLNFAAVACFTAGSFQGHSGMSSIRFTLSENTKLRAGNWASATFAGGNEQRIRVHWAIVTV